MIEAYLVEPEFFPTPVYYYNNNEDFTVTIKDACQYDSVKIPSFTAIQNF